AAIVARQVPRARRAPVAKWRARNWRRDCAATRQFPAVFRRDKAGIVLRQFVSTPQASTSAAFLSAKVWRSPIAPRATITSEPRVSRARCIAGFGAIAEKKVARVAKKIHAHSISRCALCYFCRYGEQSAVGQAARRGKHDGDDDSESGTGRDLHPDGGADRRSARPRARSRA